MPRFIIELVGPDGVGKTSLGRQIALYLRERGLYVERYHYRHRISLDTVGTAVVQTPISPKNSGPITSLLRVVRLSLARPRGVSRVVEIRERYLFDCLLDHHRYGLHPTSGHVIRFLQGNPRRLTIRLWMTDDAEAIHTRKPELTEKQIKDLQQRIGEQIAISPDWFVTFEASRAEKTQDNLFKLLAYIIEQTQHLSRLPFYLRREIWFSRTLPINALYSVAPASSRLGKARFALAATTAKLLARRMSFRKDQSANRCLLLYRRKGHSRLVLYLGNEGGPSLPPDPVDTVLVLDGRVGQTLREASLLNRVGAPSAVLDTRFIGFRSTPSKTGNGVASLGEEGFHGDDANQLSEKTFGALAFSFAPRTRSLTLQEIVPTLIELRYRVPGSFILHGDFTPWNCFDSNGRTVVLDWERATLLDEANTAEVFCLDFFLYAAGSMMMARRPLRKLSFRRMDLPASWQIFSKGTRFENHTWSQVLSSMNPSSLTGDQSKLIKCLRPFSVEMGRTGVR